MIIVGIEGNIPSMKAHSVTTVKMANAFKQSFSTHNVVLTTSGSLENYKNFIKFFPLKVHYGVSNNFKVKFLNVWCKDFFFKTIGISGFKEKYQSYLTSNFGRIEFVYARSFMITCSCIDKGIPVILETHAKDVTHPDFIKIIPKSNLSAFLGIVTIHEDLKKKYVIAGFPEEKIFVYHDGFTRDSFTKDFLKPKHNGQGMVATYVGGLYPEKGIDDIIDLAEMALGNNFKIQFNIYGGSKDQVSFYSDITTKRRITNVKFLGFVPNQNVPNILATSDILLMPYPKLENYVVMDIDTTSPIKLFEYMASGCPILTSKVSVIENILEHGKDAYLAKQGDIIDLYKGLCQILYEPDISKKFAENAKMKSKSYSWEKRVEQLSVFFKLKK